MPVRAPRRPAKEYSANLPLFREVLSRRRMNNPGHFAASEEVKEEDDMNVDRRHAIFDGNANSGEEAKEENDMNVDRRLRVFDRNANSEEEVKEEDDMNVDRRLGVFDGNANSEGVDRRAYQTPAPRPRRLS
jgi:hypothetical protein